MNRSPGWIAVLLALSFAVSAAAQEWDVSGARRVVAISDIHGAHQAFVATLRSAGVLDEATAWTGGNTHLVVVGDIVDRGDDSRRTMDLLMRLEPEAAAAGGAVHVVLGNHEIMNLVGDLRYVARGEYAAFAAEETPAMRETALQRYLAAGVPPATAPDQARAEFDARFPAGFFAHRAAFAADGKYGRWLLGKPLVLRIDGTLFAHAGLSQAMTTASLASINGALRAELREYVELHQALVAQGIIEQTTDFNDVPERLAPLRADGATPLQDAAQLARVERLLALHDSAVHAPSSPLWYRGSTACGQLVEQDRLKAALAALGAGRLVIGHTPTFQRRVWSRLDGQVVQIDAGMLRPYYHGQGAALVLAADGLSAVYEDGERSIPVAEQPARIGAISPQLPAEELEAALAAGEITAGSEVSGRKILSLDWHGTKLQAVFHPFTGSERFLPELAAYRLDRLLSLDMVPAAVERRVDGQPGVLQYVPPGLITEAERTATNTYIEAWCPLPDQFRAMYIFDALIYNEGRSPEHILYGRSNGSLVLTGHSAAFAARAGVPAYLKGVDLGLNPLWRERLAALGTPAAESALTDLLGSKRSRALLGRARALAD
jgi:hypothetical protein